MNIRATFVYFGILLAMLWLFGWSLALKRVRVDQDYVLPSLQEALDVDVHAVKLQRSKKGKKTVYTFTKSGAEWTMRQDSLIPVVRVQDGKVNAMIDEIRGARKNREADVYDDPAAFGLKNPQMTVRLNGRTEKKSAQREEWVLYIGDESPKKEFVYVNTSDAPAKVFAVRKADLNSLFFEDSTSLRPLQLAKVTEFQASKITLKRTELDKSGKVKETTKVVLQKKNDKWEYVDPKLGLAAYEGAQAKASKAPKPKTQDPGVKALIAAFNDVEVKDSSDLVDITDVPLTHYRLGGGNEYIRFEIETEVDGAKGKKTTEKHTLLIGNAVPNKNQYYARSGDDQGVAKINKDELSLITKVLDDPGVLRSRQLSFVDKSKVDAVNIRMGENQQQLVLLRIDGAAWKVQFNGKYQKADKSVIETLLNKLQDNRAILEFIDEADAKSQLKSMGLDAPAAIVRAWENGIATEPASKTDKKDKKVDPKAKKKDNVQKTKAKSKTSLTLKEDAKAAVTLSFGKVEDGLVYVKRETDGLPTTYFKVDKLALDELAPKRGEIAFLSKTLDAFINNQAVQIQMDLEGNQFLLKRRPDDFRQWRMTKQKDFANSDRVDEIQVTQVLGFLEKLQAKKWVKQLGPKADLAKYGLKKPPVTIAVTLWNGKAQDVVQLIGLSANRMAVGGMAALPDLSSGKQITYRFGSEADDESDVAGTFASWSENDLLFLVDPNVVATLKAADPRDRSGLFSLQSVVDAGWLIGMAAPPRPFSVSLPLLPTSANFTPSFAEKVSAVTVKMRTPYLTFNLKFAKGKDGWKDESGLEGFKLNPKAVDEFVTVISQMQPQRFVSFRGPPPNEFELGDNKAALTADFRLKDGKKVRIKVGARMKGRGYLATNSQWPDAIFIASGTDVSPYLRGISVFAKQP